MRLIDAEIFKEYVMKGFRDNESRLKTEEYRDFARQIAESFCRDIDEQPTAYDVNEVLRQLDEEKKLSYADLDTCSELGPLQEPEDDDYFIIGFKKATKIVKAGGL
mgnify:FL=1|nr:MAG TPA: hypothetical protein [Caudoviricetes sp.]